MLAGWKTGAELVQSV